MKKTNFLNFMNHGFLLLLLICLASCSTDQLDKNTMTVTVSESAPQLLFAADKIIEALENQGHATQFSIIQNDDEDNPLPSIRIGKGFNDLELIAHHEIVQQHEIKSLISQGFEIKSFEKNGKQLTTVIGEDIAGVMYGGLELAEQINLYGVDNIKSMIINPYMEKRGVKFNIPLDARTPSYSDMSDAGQKNIATVWDFDFWTAFLDNLATHRYNFVSLWSLHPFPSMVQVPDYPDVALNDIMISTTDWEEYYSTQAKGYDAPEIVNNLESIKTMTITDKILFWQKVMAYAKDRNIDFYVVTWNIFDYGTEGKYGITDDIENKTTIDYFRKSVKEMFVAYPLLAGIGLTTGENMPESSFEEKEDWAFETYGKGVADAAELYPDRKITFIHRQHQAGASAIARKFEPLLAHKNVDFIFSFKYAQAHVYSSTTQNFHTDFLNDIGDMKTIWTLRNDDVYLYRWGAPDFVRDFIKNIPYEVGRGYYYGSDQYIWGKEFLSNIPEVSRQLEIEKHWYQWMLWGRLGFNPDLENERFIAMIENRFPEIDGEKMFNAWQHASMIYPITTGFHWGEYDFQWYIEACKSRPGPAQNETGFHDVNRFISLPPHPATDNISIPDYVQIIANRSEPEGITPFQVAGQLHSHAEKALAWTDSVGISAVEELKLTINDIATMANLGKYYAHKIEAATHLAIYRSDGDIEQKSEAIKHLEIALRYWEQYVALSKDQYKNPFWTNRVGHVNWESLSQAVKNDIDIARNE